MSGVFGILSFRSGRMLEGEMVVAKETENEIERQLRYFLEEKLEGILDEARKVKKRRQEVLHGKLTPKPDSEIPQSGDVVEERQLKLWE